jgi:hypothetical protein
MKTGLIYRAQWNTVPVVLPPVALGGLGTVITSEIITVDIQDTSVQIDDAADPEIIDMLPGSDPLMISTINDQEDKFSPIKAKQAKITVKSDAAIGIAASTFADSSDRRFKVHVYTESRDIFLGFLMSPDIQQLFLPDPVDVVLTATDQLGLLKGTPLKDFADENPLGKYRIAEFLAMALEPTGLELQIKAVMNVRHGTSDFVFNNATFVAADKTIIFPSTQFFYAGQEIGITGTASNNSVFNVIEVGQGIVTIIRVSQTVVDETFSGSGLIGDFSGKGHLYDKIYLDAKTFESNIGECEDCYTVLEKILGEDCILFQWRGDWWIIRLDEIDDNILYPFEFNPDGSIVGALTPINPTRPIGNNSDIVHEGTNSAYRFGQMQKFIKEVYKYESPKEIVCNMDFSRGDAITPPDLSAGSSTGDYALECWTVRRTSGSITSTAFIRRKFKYGTEEERYVVITPQTGAATPYNFIESQPIELVKSDKATISVSFRFENNISGSGLYAYNIFKIYLRGVDGLFYYWWTTAADSTDLTKYRWTSSATETDRAVDMGWNLGDVNETEWRTFSVDIGPIPVDGKLYIGLYQGRQGGDSSDNQNIYYQGLNFTYQPFINGSYQLFKGQYNKVTRLTEPEKYNASREKEVFVSDSSRREFKGAMFFLDSNANYQLTRGHFYSSNVFALNLPPEIAHVHPFGYLQAFGVWNQFRNQYRIFNCNLYGFFRNEDREWPDIINKFQLSDVNPNSSHRYFLANSFEQNWKTMKWSGTLLELYHQLIGHRYDDTHEFKYTS